MTATLIELVGDTELLRDLAGPRSYERGENYAAGGYVHSITEYKGKLVATVTGTHDYQVKLWVERDSLESDCTCPVGEMGQFCKHCVATALVWASEAESADEKRSGRKTGRSSTAAGRRAGTLDGAREYLEQQSKESLIEILLEHALEDKRLRERLLLNAARANPAGLDLEAYRRAIKDAVKPGRFVDYYEAGAYAHAIRKTIQDLRELLRAGHAAAHEVIEQPKLGTFTQPCALPHTVKGVGRAALSTLKPTVRKHPRPMMSTSWTYSSHRARILAKSGTV